mmetsp:Transcript_49847/g.128253  ORF Transcript_49847/g.128253 Transcript_49847/m.128253 type:complete len:365 (-) Transcript_49847:279-1373(-)
MAKPRVIVLGGTGFIGRKFVRYMVENDLAEKIRVVDKVLPAMARLNAKDKAAFDSDVVEFKQANLTNQASVTKAFADEAGKYDVAVNLAAETKYGLDKQVYDSTVIGIVEKCVAEAVKTGVTRFVEVSTAQVYKSSDKVSDETAKLKPWTHLASAKLEGENKLLATEGIEKVILRPANVYGNGDVANFFPRVICGAVYKKLGEKYKVLWNEKLKLNTVHIDDMVKAIWMAATDLKSGEIYNVVDKNETTQGNVQNMLKEIFGIEVGYYGSVLSNLAKLKWKDAVEEANDKHMEPWAEMCKEAGIQQVLTPYINEELLYEHHMSVSSAKLEAAGFQFSHPNVTADLIKQVINEYVEEGIFPKTAM